MMKFISVDEAVNLGFLQDWYQHSVDANATPVWTDEHLEELTKDFIVIPKEALEKGKTLELNFDVAKPEPEPEPLSAKYQLTYSGVPKETAEWFAEMAIKELKLEHNHIVSVRVYLSIYSLVAEMSDVQGVQTYTYSKSFEELESIARGR